MWFHFNKPASRAAKKVQLTVHYKGACHIVDNVVCKVPTQGRLRKTQPMFVMTGRGNLQIENGVAVIS